MFVLNTSGPAAFFLNYMYHSVEHLSILNQLFMTLTKLRRYTTNSELSKMFNISENSVRNVVLLRFYLWQSSGNKLTFGHPDI